jgi:carbon-monoxide dehydrogenase medium subunit
MVIAVDFAYAKPATLEDAVASLSDHGPGARLLAGGTDLVPWMRDDVVTPELVVDLKAIPGLDEITPWDGTLHLGSLVTLTDLLSSPMVHADFPILTEMAHTFASTGIRNRATVVGNLCSAVPSCDVGPAALVYDALLHVVGPEGARDVAIIDWFVGPRATVLEPAEIVTGITFTRPPDEHAGAFVKLARYRGEDLAQASVAVILGPDGSNRVAFGAVGPTPHRAFLIERLLEREPLDDDVIHRAKALVADEISPITDLRATAQYREHMCRVMLERALRAAAARLSGNGPPCPTVFV